jgi:hypothetical protein
VSEKKPRPAPPGPPKPPEPKVTAEGVRRQRQHIKDLTGEDPLRGGVAD